MHFERLNDERKQDKRERQAEQKRMKFKQKVLNKRATDTVGSAFHQLNKQDQQHNANGTRDDQNIEEPVRNSFRNHGVRIIWVTLQDEAICRRDEQINKLIARDDEVHNEQTNNSPKK